MSNLPTTRICHLTARRMRVRIPDRRRDTAFFDDIVDRLSRRQSIERVEANPLTASILVYCSDPQKVLADITARNDLLAMDFGAERRASDTLRNRALGASVQPMPRYDAGPKASSIFVVCCLFSTSSVVSTSCSRGGSRRLPHRSSGGLAVCSGCGTFGRRRAPGHPPSRPGDRADCRTATYGGPRPGAFSHRRIAAQRALEASARSAAHGPRHPFDFGQYQNRHCAGTLRAEARG
jgi:hypothetical protein